MKITEVKQGVLHPKLNELSFGDTVIDGDGKLFIVCMGAAGMVLLVNPESGTSYTVPAKSRYEPVNAVISWSRR